MSTILLTNAYLQLHFQPKILEKSNIAHGHDNISNRMLKICGYSICVLLDMVFEQPFLTGVFPSEWKTRNIVPIHKNSDKQNIKNYYPVSLPLICGKVFERLIFNEMFNYVFVNKLISLKTSLASNLVIPVLINYYHEFLHLLIMD